MLERYSRYGWSKKAICQKWDISIKTFYNFGKTNDKSSSASKRQLNKITSDEQMAVISYALEHTELRHREMAFRMIDEDIAFMSPSSVYRILKEYNLICEKSKLQKPDNWHPHKGITEPDQVWQTDLMVLKYKARDYFLLSYMDVYSRFIVYHKLCLSMEGHTIKETSKEAFFKTGIKPNSIQSDNGSCYISQEYRSLMDKLEIEHRFIHPHCPNENAEIERYHRTLREYIDPTEAENITHLEQIINEKIDYYNYKRYHSKIGFIPPYLKYSGNPEEIFQERESKLEKAKAWRMQLNYQRTVNTTSQNIKIAG